MKGNKYINKPTIDSNAYSINRVQEMFNDHNLRTQNTKSNA
jgi:hypothetical protein